ncbi:hypothetical protein [Psychrobacter immobilis]|uniref:hypothetical protein n=1 Tax=Psychrobacter immobilis TaxID=498 RepID=UPI00191B7928|nr:hypothetical protein [Psychrobacter immobilis]
MVAFQQQLFCSASEQAQPNRRHSADARNAEAAQRGGFRLTIHNAGVPRDVFLGVVG